MTLEQAEKQEFRKFWSVAEFVSFCNSYVSPRNHHTDSVSWAGGTWEQACGYASNGDLSFAKKINALAEKISAGVDAGEMQSSWVNAEVGAFVDVPAYLSGSPECMWQQSQQPAQSEIDICVDLWAYCNTTKAQMVKRGLASAAAVIAFSRMYTVNLWVYATGHVGRCMVKMSNPLDLSEIGACVVQPCFVRQLMFGVNLQEDDKYGIGHKGIPRVEWAKPKCKAESVRQKLIELGGMSENCVMLDWDRDGLDLLEEDMLIKKINQRIADFRAANP